MSNARKLRTSVWVGGPGWVGGPSQEAQALMTAAAPTNLPHGMWHVSDHAAHLLEGATPTISTVEHIPSGERFRLACVRGLVAAIAADRTEGMLLLAESGWDDPIAWASKQQWREVAT